LNYLSAVDASCPASTSNVERAPRRVTPTHERARAETPAAAASRSPEKPKPADALDPMNPALLSR